VTAEARSKRAHNGPQDRANTSTIPAQCPPRHPRSGHLWSVSSAGRMRRGPARPPSARPGQHLPAV